MRPFAPLVVLVSCLAAAAAAEPLSPAELEKRIDEYVSPFVADGHLSGTLLVARGGDVVYENSWGMANYELGVPNTPTTRFCVASITKPMTIALVCRLAEQGKMLPDQTISSWLPGFPRADEITVSHLLNHRACIPHRVTTATEETMPRTAADMVELARNAEMLPHEPGEESVYSSAGFSVLARVCELAGEMSYADALDSLLFRPAGMTHSGHYDSRAVVPDRASTADFELRLLGLYVRERRNREPDFDMQGFARAYAVMAAQRATKILGIFARLDKRDGKAGLSGASAADRGLSRPQSRPSGAHPPAPLAPGAPAASRERGGSGRRRGLT